MEIYMCIFGDHVWGALATRIWFVSIGELVSPAKEKAIYSLGIAGNYL